MRRSIEHVWMLLIAVASLSAISRAGADESEIFLKPIRLQAEGVDIDTGKNWGHSGPCIADVDGDGLRDLVVGHFRGTFRFYKNVGSALEPKYVAFKLLIAGETEAKVPIYCCIGSSPFFVDFDNDGKLDFISGSYDPGECYFFRGVGGDKFAERQTLLDKSGQPILRHPDQKQKVESFGSWPVMVDWNNDGKLDLSIGGFDGTMFVRLNEGTRENPEFSATNIVVQAAGKDLKLPSEPAGHAAPAVADWDGDGRWDILSGCDNGGVYFFRNVGEPAAPRFDEPQILIAPHNGNGYDEVLEVAAESVPGIRTQIAAVDYFGTGKTDLLVGDFCTTVTPRADLTPAERQEFQALRAQAKENIAGSNKQMDDLLSDFKRRFPGDAGRSDEATAQRQKEYLAMRDGPKNKALKKEFDDLEEAMTRFLIKPPRKGSFNEYATTRGYVWLFVRK